MRPPSFRNRLRKVAIAAVLPNALIAKDIAKDFGTRVESGCRISLQIFRAPIRGKIVNALIYNGILISGPKTVSGSFTLSPRAAGGACHKPLI
jgi:hypothetical protein